ncbi:serine/threonine-protein kinase [Kitasatospora sp. NPDC056783]|uniref:serine/threonine-protein kinase n=1 Tax=Kitasatospora sp. NPDC056783 TaxID=3345943 RepID=UPI0036C915A1
MLLDGRYQLETLLGAGGMGTVWRGFDRRIGRTVAVKVLTLDGAPDSAVRRFFSEANATGNLSSRHIVTVHDVGRADLDGSPVAYLVMELLEGRSLDHLVEERLPDVADVIAWTVQICDALATAHRAGIVHRDIKPANVMLTADGTVKVVDFGIARHLGSRQPALTTAGNVIGTPAYMAPEQAGGDPVIGAAADLYALGCLLHTLLTGRPPFTGDAIAVLHQHLTATPAGLGTLRPGIPADLETLVLHLLAKAPDKRPPSAEAVVERLRALTPQPPLPPARRAGAARQPTLPATRRAPAAAGTARLARPTAAVGTGAVLTAAGTAAVGVLAQLTWLSTLPTPWPPVLSAVLFVLLALVLALVTKPSPSTDSSKADDSAAGLFVILPIGVIACLLLLWLSPLPWWGVLVLSWVLCPVLVLAHGALARAVAASRPVALGDLASSAGLVNGATLVLLISLTANWAWPATVLAGLAAWAGTTALLGRLLPRR